MFSTMSFEPSWGGVLQPDVAVACLVTTVKNGNLALHVGDDPSAVLQRRSALQHQLGVDIVWLDQVHGTVCVDADCLLPGHAEAPVADAACTTQRRALGILTADCLPVLFYAANGRAVGAAHAGWRGLAAGVLENCLTMVAARGGVKPAEVHAYLGPAIGPASFEVGAEVRAAFVDACPADAAAFIPHDAPADKKWLADLYGLAQRRLRRAGLRYIDGAGFDTYRDQRFFSYRREAKTGRMATLVWLR
jgi:YfiH family protein